jgi:hypothetical protein
MSPVKVVVDAKEHRREKSRLENTAGLIVLN